MPRHYLMFCWSWALRNASTVSDNKGATATFVGYCDLWHVVVLFVCTGTIENRCIASHLMLAGKFDGDCSMYTHNTLIWVLRSEVTSQTSFTMTEKANWYRREITRGKKIAAWKFVPENFVLFSSHNVVKFLTDQILALWMPDNGFIISHISVDLSHTVRLHTRT